MLFDNGKSSMDNKAGEGNDGLGERAIRNGQ